MDMLQKVHTLKPRQLRAECERLGLDTTTLVEKKDFRRALLSHALQSVPTATLRALRDQHGFADIVNKTDIIRQLVQLFDSQPNLATNATATAHKKKKSSRRKSSSGNSTLAVAHVVASVDRSNEVPRKRVARSGVNGSDTPSAVTATAPAAIAAKSVTVCQNDADSGKTIEVLKAKIRDRKRARAKKATTKKRGRPPKVHNRSTPWIEDQNLTKEERAVRVWHTVSSVCYL